MEKYKSQMENGTEGNDMQSDAIITIGQTPTINVTPSNSNFISIVGEMSTTHAFVVICQNLSGTITVIAPANYQVSSDGANWGSTTLIEANGGALYVKYLPLAVEISQVETIKLIYDGAETKCITVTGLSFIPSSGRSSYSNNHDTKSGEVKTIPTKTKAASNPTNRDNKFRAFLKLFSSYAIVLLSFIILLRIYELLTNQLDTNITSRITGFIGTALLADLLFFCTIAGYLFLFTGIIYFISRKLSRVLLTIMSIIVALGHLMLIRYFSVALNPLGSDVFQYSLAEIKLTVGSAVNLALIMTICGMSAVFVLAFIFLPRFIKVNKAVAMLFLILSLVGVVLNFNKVSLSPGYGSEYNNNLVLNKSTYFYNAVWQYYFPKPKEDIFDDISEKFADNLVRNIPESRCANDFVFMDDTNYPFLHADSTKDVLSPFFNKGITSPNIVIIVVEGLGRAFTNENAYLGSFTPFIDSLSRHSLYWENCLSSAGRTFSVSPSVLGSLPYGQHGFAELGEHMPSHLGLISILVANGYKSSFFYGGDSKFDNMKLFMERQHINHIYDESTYDYSYKKLPANPQGFSWGYGDSELFRRYLAELDKQPDNTPQANILLTIATHSPFKLNDQSRYDALFEKRMQDLKFDAASIKGHREYKPQYASIMYMDDAIRHFFKSYASRPSFANTIFIITGDHRMPDIPMSTKIDRYHVPLIIFSPLLKRTAKFSAVVSHLDITPSILAYVKKQYHIKSPSLVTWLGAGVDTVRYFRNRNNYPLIPTKQGVSEYLSGNYMISGNSLFQLSANMGLDPLNNDDKEQARLTQLMNKFIQLNERMITQKKMLPDSILNIYSVQ